MVSAKDKTPFVLGGLLLFLGAGVGLYLWFNSGSVVFPWKRFGWYSLLIFGVVSVVGFVVYQLLNRVVKSGVELDRDKDLVHSSVAKRVWIEEFCKENEITTLTPKWGDGRPRPANPKAVKIRNRRIMTDPSLQTSDIFLLLEAVVSEGNITGMVTGVVPMDRGEKYLRENWDTVLKFNEGLSSGNLEMKKYPLTSAPALASRLAIKRAEMSDEGFSESEIEREIAPFERAVRSPQPVREGKEAKVESKPVVAPAPVVDDGVDVSDIEVDIEAWRSENP